MSKSYRHIQECNKEIIELKHNGCPVSKYVKNIDLAKILLYIILNVHYRIHGKKIRGREEILLGVTSRPYILKSTYIGNNTG